MFALVLVGPPGAGKSAVLEALSDLLVIDDIAHALVETEWLTATHPPLEDARWFAHVRTTCGLHREQGQPLLLVVATVESAADLRALLNAVGADEHAVVGLEAKPQTLRQRIVDREPASWSGLEELVATATRLGPVISALDRIDLALNTDGQQPSDIAKRIRDTWPAPLGGVKS